MINLTSEANNPIPQPISFLKETQELNSQYIIMSKNNHDRTAFNNHILTTGIFLKTDNTFAKKYMQSKKQSRQLDRSKQYLNDSNDPFKLSRLLFSPLKTENNIKVSSKLKKMPISLKMSMPYNYKRFNHTSCNYRNKNKKDLTSRNTQPSAINHQFSQNTDEDNSTNQPTSMPFIISNIKYTPNLKLKSNLKQKNITNNKPIESDRSNQGINNIIIENNDDDNHKDSNPLSKLSKLTFASSKTVNFSSFNKCKTKDKKLAYISEFQSSENELLLKNEIKNENIINAILDEGTLKSIQDSTIKSKRKKTLSSQHLTLKNKMMQKMKSINLKRLNRQIFIPVSTLLALTNKPLTGQSYIKDFQGKIYSAKLSQTNFVFSNIHHSFFIEQNIFGLENFFLFGVFECEGNEGYQIASIAKMNFIYFFSSEFIYNTVKKPTEEEIYLKLIEDDYKLLKVSFDKIANDISLSRYKGKTSGVSLSLALVVGNKLICASVGLVKAMSMLYRNENGKEYLNAYEFSQYHTLNNPEEKKRIESLSKGVAHYDEKHNTHKYILENECLLNMKLTRALGLKQYRPYGLINVPEINEIIINHDCKCLFIANKGFYDVLGSTFILKMLCLGISQKEAILATANKILNTYKKRLSTTQDAFLSTKDPDCVFLIIYF